METSSSRPVGGPDTIYAPPAPRPEHSPETALPDGFRTALGLGPGASTVTFGTSGAVTKVVGYETPQGQRVADQRLDLYG
mgnify:CR=1 FL=1